METLNRTLAMIKGMDEIAQRRCQEHLNNLTKPPGSLGKLEEVALKIAGITGDAAFSTAVKEVILMAGDHGIVEEGVSAFPQEVTGQMVQNFINGGAAINVLSRQVGADIRLVDIGMIQDVEHPGLVRRKLMRGTNNFAHGPAMSRETAIEALEVGISLAEDAAARGVNLLATGEMGIGNTTPSSALLVAFTGISVAEAVGRGTGIDDNGLRLKTAAIEAGLAVNSPNPHDPLDVLAKVGGLEIAGLAGLILGAAAQRIPIVIDGFISSAAALTAARLCPAAVQYMLASHVSAEPGHRRTLEEIGIDPILYMNMRLGEGTGAVLVMHVIEAAEHILKEMATFDDAGISH